MFESLECRRVLASVWQNPVRDLDIDNDLEVTPLDVLSVVNKLNSNETDFRLGFRNNTLDYYYDTDGDQIVSPLDVLKVVNAINAADGPHYPVARIPGASEPGPAGFISVPIVQLPGTKGDSWELSFEIRSQSRRFHELGVFSIENASGDIGGVSQDATAYPFEAFRSQRQSLFSHRAPESSRNTAIFGGGDWISVYVLQRHSPVASPKQHLQIVDKSLNSFTLKWAERSFSLDEANPFEDAVISVTIRPVNRNPIFEGTPPNLIRAGSIYQTRIQSFDSDGDQVRYGLLGPSSCVSPGSVGEPDVIGLFFARKWSDCAKSTLEMNSVAIRNANEVPLST